MKVQIHPSWEFALRKEFESAYFHELTAIVKTEYKETLCYPSAPLIFSAFNCCPVDQVKVVLLGQDPYHGDGQADGLCFSVPEGITHPPSLINIFKEIQTDLHLPYPKSGNLVRWAHQGVLLLNATLTVQAHQPGSHQKKGWEQFTDSVIRYLSAQHTHLVFMLWGGYAKQKSKFIDTSKHLVLTSGHPSPLSANRGYWFGNKHFSKCNAYLARQGKKEIQW
ncbi:MAG: uracil-DNA glycosylase [Flavobacteriaceae bacterium]|nr:uracil-DNA glycosylase [Flavobacteriia bacterium]